MTQTEEEQQITVVLPDGNELALGPGASGLDAAEAIGPGLARAALAIKVEGELRDLAAPLADGDRIEILTERDPEALELIRHDAAHVMATAVQALYPGTRVTIGPAIQGGFYYDFDFPEGVTVTEADLPAIEDEMRRHIKAAERFERRDLPVAEAIELFRDQGEEYKVELIEDWSPTRRSRPFRSIATVPSKTSVGVLTARRPTGSRRSSWNRLPAPTGAATRTGRC